MEHGYNLHMIDWNYENINLMQKGYCERNSCWLCNAQCTYIAEPVDDMKIVSVLHQNKGDIGKSDAREIS